MQNHSN